MNAHAPIAGIGDNGGPALDPFDGHKVHMDDLLTEAHNWADGTTVETQEQADEASRLIDDLAKAAKAAEALRVEEKAPLDEQIAAIQAKFNAYIADPKTKNPGKVWKAIAALKATVKPYLDKLEAERLAAAAEARRVADEAARVAAEAVRAAAVSNLAAQEAAEEQVVAAKRAAMDASRIENSRTQARGGERAMGLTKTQTAVIEDPRACLFHYWGERRERLVAVLQQLADEDFRAKRFQIPGVRLEEGTRL